MAYMRVVLRVGVGASKNGSENNTILFIIQVVQISTFKLTNGRVSNFIF